MKRRFWKSVQQVSIRFTMYCSSVYSSYSGLSSAAMCCSLFTRDFLSSNPSSSSGPDRLELQNISLMMFDVDLRQKIPYQIRPHLVFLTSPWLIPWTSLRCNGQPSVCCFLLYLMTTLFTPSLSCTIIGPPGVSSVTCIALLYGLYGACFWNETNCD